MCVIKSNVEGCGGDISLKDYTSRLARSRTPLLPSWRFPHRGRDSISFTRPSSAECIIIDVTELVVQPRHRHSKHQALRDRDDEEHGFPGGGLVSLLETCLFRYICGPLQTLMKILIESGPDLGHVLHMTPVGVSRC